MNQYYIEQNTETSSVESLKKALVDVKKSISDLIRAIEQGIITVATKKRIDELDEQKEEIEAAYAAAKLKQNLGMKKEHILYFLQQFVNMDYSDLDC